MLIKEELETYPFSPAEAVTVAFILREVEVLENLSIQAIAKKTYTQPSTLVRIAKKLGFKGWVDFKKAYLAEHNYLTRSFTKVDSNIPFSALDNPMSIAKKIGILEKATIDDLISLLHYDQLSKAKKLLSQAEMIYIFAQSANIILAEDFALKMRRIGKTVHIATTLGEERYVAHNMMPNAIAIFISTSGETQPILDIVLIAKKAKIKTIGITSIGNNQLSQEVDLFLPMTTREKLFSKIGNFTTNISVHVLLDILYSLTFSSQYDFHLEHLKESGQKIDFRNSATTIMEE